MSLVSGLIESVARNGEITHDFTLKGLKIVLRTLKTEEQFLSDGMIDTDSLRKKYEAEILTLNDTIAKYRSLGKVALSIKTINGQSPVDTNESLPKQFKQRVELRDELMGLGSAAVDQLIKEYNVLLNKEQQFYSDLDENLGK